MACNFDPICRPPNSLISMPNSVVCFGEIMLRLCPLIQFERLEKTHALKMDFAGAESNVAVSLAKLGQTVGFVTCLPDNAIGNAAINNLRQFGVDTRFVRRSGKRVGTYFIEYGASLRASQVTYDRAFSAISQVQAGDFDWETILAGKDWLMLTGITPALSDGCREQCLMAITAARKLGVKVAFDLNFRRTLWSREAARLAFDQILPNVDLLFANAGSVADVFGWDAGHAQNWEEHQETARNAVGVLQQHVHFARIALTIREHSPGSGQHWGGLFYNNGQFYNSRCYPIEVIERLGGGDAFAAGILHGLSQQWEHAETIEFAAAASALKHTIPGDLNLVSEAEILDVAGGNLSGLIKR